MSLSRARRLVLLAVVALGLGTLQPTHPATADTLHLVGGRTLQGSVVQEDPRGVVFETHRHGAALRVSVPTARIASLERSSREGVAVAYLPAIGAFGTGQPATGPGGSCVTAAGLEEGLRLAAAAGAERVVLVIDSPGGRIDELSRVLEVLRRPGRPPVTAYVRQALSAAAVLALACDDLVVAPGATLGAAVPLTLGPDGTPANVEAKYRSAYLSLLRQAATAAGRDPSVLLAMADERVKLYEVDTAAGPRLTSHAPVGLTRVHKAAGEILTLTAEEALRFGVARAASDKSAGVPAAMGLGAWHSVGEQPWQAAVAAGAQANRERERATRARAAGNLRRAMEPGSRERRALLQEIDGALDRVEQQISAVENWKRDTLAALDGTAAQRRRNDPRLARDRAQVQRQHAEAVAELQAHQNRLLADQTRLRRELEEADSLVKSLAG